MVKGYRYLLLIICALLVLYKIPSVTEWIAAYASEPEVSQPVDVGTDNSPPIADAGPDQTVAVGDTVQLDGTGSTDVDGDLVSYAWSFVSTPADSGAALSDPSAVNPTFKVNLPGTYVVQLIVNDGTADSAPDRVEITTQNSPPAADAGPDQTVSVGNTVKLDGSNSADVDGDPLSYKWSLRTVPPGSQAALSNPYTVDPSFYVDQPGAYVAQLVVSDGTVDSAADTVTIDTRNSRPVANAGADRTALTGQAVVLDGSGSSDADGDVLSYQWSLIAQPENSTASLTGAETVNPSFVPDQAGIYVAQLIVNDGAVESGPDTAKVTIKASADVNSESSDEEISVRERSTVDL